MFGRSIAKHHGPLLKWINMLIPLLAFPDEVLVCMIIQHPVESKLRGSVRISQRREDYVLSQAGPRPFIFPASPFQRWWCAYNADHTLFLQRQYLYALFSKIVPLGCEALLGALLYPISFTQTAEAILYRQKKKKSWIGHFTDEHSVPLMPPRNPKTCKSLKLGGVT